CCRRMRRAWRSRMWLSMSLSPIRTAIRLSCAKAFSPPATCARASATPHCPTERASQNAKRPDICPAVFVSSGNIAEPDRLRDGLDAVDRVELRRRHAEIGVHRVDREAHLLGDRFGDAA